MNASQIVRVWVETLEPGTHVSRESVSRRLAFQTVLPFEDCSETRPDWGEYSPVVTFSATERTLRRLGMLPPLGSGDERYLIGVESA